MNIDLELLQSISLAVAQAREVDTVLQMVVNGLGERAGFALTRIWLLRNGDAAQADASEEVATTLRLAASAGRSVVDGKQWTSIAGEFARIPVGSRKIGYIAQKGESLQLDEGELATSHWTAYPEWIARENIKSFVGHPLIFRGEVLGVLAVFSRQPISPQESRWLRLFADQAAVSIANARAFGQIQHLRDRLEMENEYLRSEVQQNFGGFVGRSPALQRILQQVDLVAPTDSSVLIQGESGTGKELVARAIHERSKRKARALVKVNCASIPHELFESEFFGHVKGAFTGALRDRAGRFQLADGGTLFLDEVGEIPLPLQSKLLRVLQEGEFERVGEEQTRRVDVRIIAAANQELTGAIAAGRFREDLFFRLSVFPLEVPPLRARPEDIPILASHFLAQAASRLKIPAPMLTQANVQELTSYPWPGNIRELQNVIERAAILSKGGALHFHLQPLKTPSKKSETPPPLTQKQWLKSQRPAIEAALGKSSGKIYGPGGAAELLNLRPTTLISRLNALGIKRK
ncbi:MAG: Fis family transcriptional regulator [Verrucomicrobiales bacterium]|nr:Fis family transcriptional regulator [Verrucomicrobiales bacterium]